jgi:hypothetical protein
MSFDEVEVAGNGPVLSYVQAQPLLAARSSGACTAPVSLDLGISTIEAGLNVSGIRLPDGRQIAWDVIEAIAADEQVCYVLENGAAQRIEAFSEQLNRFYSLMPTSGAPTVVIGGFSMHRIKGTDPQQDTLKKLRALGKPRGQVLDTTTGLGYTAIAAARSANRVVTIELDPTTLQIARYNPWSRGLFAGENIEQLLGNAYEVVQQFADHSFSCIIHDPPMFSLAGELYSGALYRQLQRILKPRGKLFHYIGNLESKSGRGIMQGVMRRLGEAGFSRIVRKPEAFGLVAGKE